MLEPNGSATMPRSPSLMNVDGDAEHGLRAEPGGEHRRGYDIEAAACARRSTKSLVLCTRSVAAMPIAMDGIR
jgi:hypothetical protein